MLTHAERRTHERQIEAWRVEAFALLVEDHDLFGMVLHWQAVQSLEGYLAAVAGDRETVNALIGHDAAGGPS
jgi:hypothetical protein